MTTKFIVTILFLIGLAIAVVEGVPQKVWYWAVSTELGGELYTAAGGNLYLPGPLRGAFDSIAGGELTRQGVIEHTNRQRETEGLLPLHQNSELDRAAEAKLEDMFKKQYFEHESPEGKGPAEVIKGAGYSYLVVGENLALGSFHNDATLVQAWMDSPGHRANIMNNRFQEIGVAVRKGSFEGQEVWLAVQEFGTPLSFCPQPNDNLKDQINDHRSKLRKMEADLAKQKQALDSGQYKTEQEHNEAVADYNTLVRDMNSLSHATESLVNTYNAEVKQFNGCLESNT
jgi:hypothetical protein